MASTAKILSWRFCYLNIVGRLLKRRLPRGGHGHPRTPPPPPAMPLSQTYFALINQLINFSSALKIIRYKYKYKTPECIVCVSQPFHKALTFIS